MSLGYTSESPLTEDFTMSTATLLPPIASTGIGDDDLYEVVDGQRIGQTPIGVYAVWTAFQLARHLGNFADAKLGRTVTEALFHLPAPINRDRRPDVAFVSYERWAKERKIPRTSNAWDVVPSLATEVVSPTDIAEELQDKIAEYFRAGVQMVWVVYPTLCMIHVYEAIDKIDALTINDVLDGGAVVPGFRLPLAELFADGKED
jgi:Uma2 family endonuclease